MKLSLIIWESAAILLFFIFAAQLIFLIIVSRKTHAVKELKASMRGTPIALFFQDNKYCEWRNTKPDAGLIEDKDFGTFIINSTYIDKMSKNIFIPYNTNYADSLNVKSAKLCDDITYLVKRQNDRKKFKNAVMSGQIPETDGLNTLRTSVNFSSIKHFVSPVLPLNIQSKISNTVMLRLKSYGKSAAPNIILLVIAILGALILGGLLLRYMVFTGGG